MKEDKRGGAALCFLSELWSLWWSMRVVMVMIAFNSRTRPALCITMRTETQTSAANCHGVFGLKVLRLFQIKYSIGNLGFHKRWKQKTTSDRMSDLIPRLSGILVSDWSMQSDIFVKLLLMCIFDCCTSQTNSYTNNISHTLSYKQTVTNNSNVICLWIGLYGN